MHRIIFIALFLSGVCCAQDYCKYNKTRHKITGGDISVFGIIDETDIDAPNSILPKLHGAILNWGVGISIKKRIIRNEYLKTELSFIQKGSHYTFPNYYRESIRLNYIEIPILWSHGFYRNKKSFFLETGLAISILFLSSGQIATYTEQSQIPNAQNFKRFDFPWIVSIKAPLNPRGKNNFYIGLRASYSSLSIHNTFKTESIRMQQDNGMHHISCGVQLDYIFKR